MKNNIIQVKNKKSVNGLSLIHTSKTLSLAYYWDIDGEPTPYIDVYLNAEESQDIVNEVSKEINHVRRGKGIKKYIDRAITRAGSSNGKDNGNHGNNTSIPHRAGNDKLDRYILRKGRYFNNPSLYVKTQRADRYNRDRVNTVSSSPTRAQRKQMIEHVEDLAKRLHLDNIEIVNSVSGLEPISHSYRQLRKH